jgi:ESCRT-I complex subunit VPS28
MQEVDESQEMRLMDTSGEKRLYEALADLYEIIHATEHLESAYVRDVIKPEQYTSVCNKLLGAFRSQEQTLRQSGAITDVQSFMQQYNISAERAYKRLVQEGVPATALHKTADDRTAFDSALETDSVIISAMNGLQLNLRAVDEILPLISMVCESFNRLAFIPSDFEPKIKMQSWLLLLNSRKAYDVLSEEECRQLSFDLNKCYSDFRQFMKFS